jgi:hypothetical protein
MSEGTRFAPVPPVADRYEEMAATKLWSLLPEIYRTEDGGADLDRPGPLQELLARLGVQVAVIRRSLDRLWDDQSIESCEDWVIPYIGALLDTNLVPTMDARGQRLDVANTINYRRRKGTLGLIEQLAADVTGWECRAVEFFRALSRRRHLLDPEIGRPADSADPAGARRLQRAELLVGLLTGTPAGGFADLRSAPGAGATGSAFDEYHHRLDVRRGRGALGWYGIPKLGVFLWRYQSFSVDRATPVGVAGCKAGHYAFDPTGRQIALWQADDRPPDGYGEQWQPMSEWQVPGPIDPLVYGAILLARRTPPPAGAWPDPSASLWPMSLSVSPSGGGVPLPQEDVGVWTDVGRLKLLGTTPQAEVEVGYHYGLRAMIGAGPYDRRQACVRPPADPPPITHTAGGSAIALRDTLAAIAGSGTVIVTDGLTSTAVAPVGSPASPIIDVTIRAADERRAVVRLAPGAGDWVLDAGSPAAGTPGGRLRLEGLLMSGQDIVLRGRFDEVVVSCCTLDPGTAGDLRDPPLIWEPAVDGQPLRATRLWIEGDVKSLSVERSILGPVRTRLGGLTEEIAVSDSVIQGLPSGDGAPVTPDDVFDADGLFRLLAHRRDPLTQWLAGQLNASAAAVSAHVDGTPVPDADLAALLGDLNAVIAGPSIWAADRFAQRTVSPAAVAEAEAGPTGAALTLLNRRLLGEAFPVELHDAAVASATGTLWLCRTAVLGCGYAHRLECSESILDDVFIADDTQDGCVRFSAWSTDSLLPRKYESVRIQPQAPIFESRRFGESFYAAVSDGADAAIVDATTAGRPSIRNGGRDGFEMGAFCSESTALRERSLQIKLDEYMPVGLTPVLIPMPPFDAEAERERGRPWPPT